MEFNELQQRLIEFVEKRNLREKHSPKNLAMALSVEVAELVEIFQWMKESDSRLPSEKVLNFVKDEIADIMIYALHITNELKINPYEVIHNKITINEKRNLV